MIAEKLLEKITSSIFDNIDFDKVPDLCDEDQFDSEWTRVYRAIEDLKKSKGYCDESRQICDDFRKSAYLKVYNLCEDDELAAYISDDFGLICDSELMEYTDEWLCKLIEQYQTSKFPYGEL